MSFTNSRSASKQLSTQGHTEKGEEKKRMKKIDGSLFGGLMAYIIINLSPASDSEGSFFIFTGASD